MITVKNCSELDKEIGSGKSIVKISTPGCGPCRMVKESMKLLEKEYADVKFIDIDADECDEELIDRFSVGGVPYVACFKDGRQLDETIGLQMLDQLKTRIEALNQI